MVKFGDNLRIDALDTSYQTEQDRRDISVLWAGIKYQLNAQNINGALPMGTSGTRILGLTKDYAN